MKKLLLLLPLLSLFTIFGLLSPRPAFAQLGTGSCATASKPNGIDTALGCIDMSSFSTFATWFLTWGIGIAGGIAFLFILYSVLLITTSQGDPKKLQAGQEQLTSAITGLILVIFAVFVLRVIGVDIFCIPGFGTC